MHKRVTLLGAILLLALLSHTTAAMAATVSPVVSPGAISEGADFYRLGKKLYVSDRSNDRVLVYKGTTLDKTITVGDYPIGVAVDQVAKKVYVINAGSPKTVSVIDATTDSVTGTWDISSTDTPYQITVNSATQKVYIADIGYVNGGVVVLDGTTGSITKTIAMQYAGPWAIKANSTTNKIYVATFYSGEARVIDGATDTDAGVVGNVLRPSFIAINETTNRVYICEQYGGGFSQPTIIDGAADTSLGSAPFNASAVAIDETNGRLYASYGGSMNIYSTADHSPIEINIYTDVPADYSFWSPYEAMAYVYAPGYDKLATVQDGTPLSEPSDPPVVSSSASSAWSLALAIAVGAGLLVISRTRLAA